MMDFAKMMIHPLLHGRERKAAMSPKQKKALARLTDSAAGSRPPGQ